MKSIQHYLAEKLCDENTSVQWRGHRFVFETQPQQPEAGVPAASSRNIERSPQMAIYSRKRLQEILSAERFARLESHLPVQYAAIGGRIGLPRGLRLWTIDGKPYAEDVAATGPELVELESFDCEIVKAMIYEALQRRAVTRCEFRQ